MSFEFITERCSVIIRRLLSNIESVFEIEKLVRLIRCDFSLIKEMYEKQYLNS